MVRSVSFWSGCKLTDLTGCQNLRYSLIALDTFDTIQAGKLALPRGRTVSWIGVTEEGVCAFAPRFGIFG